MILATLAATMLDPVRTALPLHLVNPDFEVPVPERRGYGSHAIPGWSLLTARGYRVHVVPRGEFPVRAGTQTGHVVFMGYFARSGPDRGSFTGIYQTIDARRWRGRNIRVSVLANPAHFAANRAWLDVEAGPARARRTFDQVEQWRRYAVELAVPPDAETLTITIGTNGDASVDDVSIEPAPR
jgi:hypothetical protein